MSYLLMLHNTVRKLCGTDESLRWDPEKVEDPAPDTNIAAWSDTGSLHIHELSWLYNETGMVAFCQGSMNDAYSHFRAAQVINKVVDRDGVSYRYLTTELNMALVEIDRGRLNFANQRLLSLLAHQHVTPDFLQTVHGFLGMVSFYGGDRDAAMNHLEQSIGEDAAESFDQRIRYKRRASIFLRFRANLYLLDRDNKKAKRNLDRSLALAQSGNHPDLIYYADIAQARFNRLIDNKPSWELLDRAHEFAWRLGSRRMEVEVKLQQAETALSQGNGELAYDLATQGLSMARTHSLLLLATNCLVLKGGALINQARQDQAIEVLELTRTQARRQGYEYMLEQIDKLESNARELRQPSVFLL